MTGRVFNGNDWANVEEQFASGKDRPVLPILDGDGRIFVSIPSFRDGGRCGKTIVDAFAKAKNPDDIIFGIIDQSYEEDLYCLEAYCKEMGTTIYRKRSIRKDTTKVIAEPEKKDCPRVDQIRKLSVFNTAAKGPVWARSLVRKVLGNEEFCLQIDAHTQFVQDWDQKLKHEWAATGNEFGIISTVPPALDEEKTHYPPNGDTVPRSCLIKFMEVGVPHYTSRADGKAEKLNKPLLAHTWSAGFSFSKCHLEESAPYDPFTPYVMGVEQFHRFARFWTRGYDVYTPTQNIIYHDFAGNPDGHGPMEWLRPRFERLRQAALKRVRSTLELPDGQEGLNLANLGLYGLGRRRTLDQMSSFLHVDMKSQSSRAEMIPCGNDVWVPYDANISPMANLYDKPNDLDPQPEFPLRTELTFYHETDWQSAKQGVLEGDVAGQDPLVSSSSRNLNVAGDQVEPSPFPSATLLFVLWIIGLCAWCVVFAVPGAMNGSKTIGKGRPSSNHRRTGKDA